MKRLYFFLLAVLVIFILLLQPANCQHIESIPGIKLISLSMDELSELGVNTSAETLEYYEKTFVQDGHKDKGQVISRKVEVNKMIIDLKNADENAALNSPDFAPRLVVYKFSQGSAFYFRSSIDYYTYEEANKNVKSDSIDYSFVNNLICIYVHFAGSGNEAFLWYEPGKEFIESLPDIYREELYNEFNDVDIVSEEQSRYTDVWRQQSGGLSNTQIYPNPVNNIATFSFQLTGTRTISIAIHDISGRLIRIIAQNNNYTADTHSIEINVTDLPSGMYLVSLTTDRNEQVVQRLIVNH